MSIRVCHVMSADLWAGAEIQLATLASYLVARPDIEMTAVLFNEGRLACELQSLGIPTVVIDERRHGAAQIVSGLVRHLTRHQIDLVHTHRYKDSILGALAGKVAGVRHAIRSVHGLTEAMRGWPHLKFAGYDLIDRTILRYTADRVIAVSNHMAQQLGNKGYKTATLVSIWNGVNLEKLKPVRSRADVRAELGLGPGTVLIGTVGRLVPVKGHALLLRAARLVRQRTPDTKFIIVGDGPLRHDLRSLAGHLGLDDVCLFPGARSDVPDLLAAMDIFTLPSLSEGMPLAALEAMALARPVIATSVGGVPEAVTHGETGLLVRPGDEYAFADACVELVKDDRRAACLGERGKAVVESQFSYDRNGQAIAALYHAVCRPGHEAPAQPVVHRPLRSHAHALEQQPIETPGLLRFGWHLGRAFTEVARRRLTGAIDWCTVARRMRKVRRDPAALTRALRSAGHILMVCHGNIIRSPFAARLVADAVGNHRGIAIRSGGLAAIAGKPSHPRAVVAARKQRIDLTDHHAAPLDTQIVASSDVIFVMEVEHLLEMRRRFPDASAKTFLLTCLAAETPLEIHDPYNGDLSRFEACFAHITRAVLPITRTLSTSAG